MEKSSLDKILAELNIEVKDTEAKVRELEKDLTEFENSIVQVVSTIIINAIKERASDIHIEPYERNIRIRYRIDGVLTEIKRLPKTMALNLLSRLKIMSNLDIAEKRIPQDGRFRSRVEGRDIDFRVSIIPTIYGEKAVLRILDTKNFSNKLIDLGFSEINYEKILKAIKKSYGMIIIVGPTGSGKTTTLYSILNHLNKIGINILTAEDPIEYEIAGINQVQCRNDIGLGFSNLLRNFLRQDPDVVMIGEIRDRETGEMALKASLTGHLIFSTLHTQNVFTAISRLINLGLEPHLIATSILLIQSQRLVRKLCPYCKVEDTQYLEKIRELGIDEKKYVGKKFYKSTGCEQCNEGYRGRIVFEEVLLINDEIRKMIEQKNTALEISKYVEKQGIENLQKNGIKKALMGITSLDEIIRVC